MDGVSSMIGKKAVWILVFIGVALLNLNTAQAFGVTAPYWKENPLVMSPGETKEITFALQNMVGDEDMQVTVTLIEDKRYVTLLGSTEYEVPAKTKDIPVVVRIVMPQETPKGTTFPLRIAFRSTAKAGVQQVQLGTGIEKRFDIIVGQGQDTQQVEAPAPQKESALWKKPATPALIVLVIVFILWLLLRKSRKAAKKSFNDNARW